MRLRLETGLTQQKLAEKAGLSVPTISRLEKGDLRISARNLELLLNFFGMTLASAALDGSDAGPAAREKKDTYAKW
jgi:transcriptional regulator with XRE-family HTH domain